MSIINNIEKDQVPKHVAIIMDGNGRWAKKLGNLRIFGHKSGVKTVKVVVEAAAQAGVKFLTLYAFSTENWNRPKLEVEALMQLLVSTISSEIEKLHKQGVRLLTIGNIESLPSKVQKKLNDALKLTENNKGLTLVLALSYSSRWEITNAANKIIEDVKLGKISDSNITEDEFSKYLTTYNVPDPDLLIRTSGEYRISNFLLWQIAYSELYFTEKLWPEFTKDDFFNAIINYQERERRYGKTSEQV